ncbi:uncharacterized protein LOC114319847 [Camellia sinensis]|uniref:uncharacterized protein LOC114319847 n=1 Tax=Camellia sinensis TaxID=4442 RepID=UPI00103633F3|nr:uncharacterized protein LOC114319847 [Camellia sinensis]
MTVTDLFWAHPVSLDLLRTFPRVVIMDCTYKTNRLPLLEIVGVTSTHMTFSMAIAYLQTERVDNFAWALQILRDLMDDSVLLEVIFTDRELALMNAINNTFPNARHLLCRWVESALARLKKHIQVKASFEKSLTTVQHQFKLSQFRELRGNVSICALEYVLAESKRANSVGIDVVACGCVLRRTHGLPCAHEIANYMRQSHPIPLSSIHFNEFDIVAQLDMLKKLREIANLASTFLIEPGVKPNPRRGHKKTDISCRRDPCAFELVDDGHDSSGYVSNPVRWGLGRDNSQSTLASSQSKKKRPSKVLDKKRNVKTKTYRTRTSLLNAYTGDFLPMLIPFVKLMKDVDGNGNCGFRTIAGLLGLGENDWVQCLTFLPLRSPPATLVDRREIAIGFVNGNHFVQVFFKADHLVSPIAVLWQVRHHPCASKWEDAYVSRIQKFKDNIGPNVATRETFDVVDID